jgi:radical SAM superfamily enzyme YgiQ (UPF0313 family)
MASPFHVHLVAPSNEDTTHIKPLWAATLAAHTPDDVELTFRDDGLDPIDLARESDAPDLVGISVTTKTAVRAYAIADSYRARGSRVVLGGIHVTALPAEAGEHADAVVIGESEWIWQDVVRDARCGELGRKSSLAQRALYRRDEYPPLVGLPLPRRGLMKSVRYVPFDVVQTTRGCPFRCEFCSVSANNGTKLRFRPVPEVIAELETCGPRILFSDDNVMIHPQHSRELFQAMVPLRKSWVGEASLAALRRVEDVEGMARSGCRAIAIGFESISNDALRDAGKHQNRPQEYREVVRSLSDHGIAVWGSFIFGLDGDSPDAFERTVEFCIDAKVTVAVFALLTPYPGTPLYQRLKAAGRITRDAWWLSDDHDKDAPFYRPATMSREALRAGWVRAWRAMYSWSSIRRRYDFGMRNSWVQNVAYWPLNLLMHEVAEKKIARGDHAWRKHRTLDLPLGF